jgi:hypothetical protein
LTGGGMTIERSNNKSREWSGLLFKGTAYLTIILFDIGL